MARTRVFYGHEGVVLPTGLRPRSAAAPAPEDDDLEAAVAAALEAGYTEDDLVDSDGQPLDAAGIRRSLQVADDDLVTDAGSAVEPADVIETTPGSEANEPVAVLSEPIDLPTSDWKVAEIDAFAEEHGIEFEDGAKKPAKLDAVKAWAESLPTLPDDPEGE